MATILVVHGAGINMRGKSQIDIFGTATMEDYNKKIKEYAVELGVEIDIFHSNIEGEVINKFYEAHRLSVVGAIINPAGYSSGYPALAACIKQVAFPTVEVHISNPSARGAVSQIAPSCKGVVTGFGLFGYFIAMKGILDLTDES